MKKRCILVFFIAIGAALSLIACSSDNEDEQGGGQQPSGQAYVTLRIATDNGISGAASTRAWEDENAKTDRTEMMYSWIVLITDGTTIKYKYSGSPTNDNAEIDNVCTKVAMASGTYTVYSFANISEESLKTMLNVASLEPDTDLADATVEAATATINGNGFIPSANNGIPMSNKQTLIVPDSGLISKDLIVVRMLAKIEVQVFNDGTSDATIESISLTDVTANVANNLKLLPNLTSGADKMGFVHKDIQPNLATTSRGNLTYTPASDKDVTATGHRSDDGTPVIFTFYVNESNAPDNGSGLFYLTLGIKTGTGEDVVYSHALINQPDKTSTDNDAWNYIARNDYRIIPVILTDWEFRIEPIAFVPIGGYPATLLSSDAQKATFSTGGMIALQPFVKKRTDTTWRDFEDSEVKPKEVDAWNESITWKNNDGTKVSGTDKIIKMPFTYDPVAKCIIGELNNDLSGTEKTAVTITVKLGTAPTQYTYSFTCDVNLQK